jgi:hypothetical protein
MGLLEDPDLDTIFPNFRPALRVGDIVFSSEEDEGYNCIAWAAGKTTERWWPGWYGYHWPRQPEAMTDIQEFLEVFATLSYSECEGPDFEAGFEKVAIYTDPATGDPKHMARQVEGGVWLSKMGDSEDIRHTVRSIEGPFYGFATRFLRRGVARRGCNPLRSFYA